ncbi:MAG: cation diffusion facilitator family transporter [Bifidobacteriaceae bacterium]|jgi:cation diffusion facilitator family transporter|nr:cation diffusion facilitator family transporter [Bifidobacteriaceae bacterium]MCI1914899.1 cation diffusion facilitator family transporter [Bifidobacteriaceae bacterium]
MVDQVLQADRYGNLKKAERGAIISICAYILLSGAKLVTGYLANSDALRADGLNNFTDVLSSVAVFIGLRFSRIPADDNHRYGHWKAENIASLVTSFIMVAVGAEVLLSSITSIVRGEMETPDFTAAIVGIISAGIMYGVYFYNKSLASKVQSPGLLAAAKDNRSDAWTSIGTAIAVFAASFNLAWLDATTAIVIGILILKTAVDIFRDSVFSLSDGFNEDLLDKYRAAVMEIPGVLGVRVIRARTYGSNIDADVVITVPPEMTVRDSHAIADRIEDVLLQRFNVYETTVHIEPNEGPTAMSTYENNRGLRTPRTKATGGETPHS